MCGQGLDEAGLGLLQQHLRVEGHCRTSWEITGLGWLTKWDLQTARECAAAAVAA